MGKLFSLAQPTRPTQPSIPPGSVYGLRRRSLKGLPIGLRAAMWLHTKVRDRGLELPPKLYAGVAGPVCDDIAAEAAYYVKIMALCE